MILWVIELEAKGVCLTQITEPTAKIPAKALESRRNFYGEFVPLFFGSNSHNFYGEFDPGSG